MSFAKKVDAELAEKQSVKEPCESTALGKPEAGVTSACQNSATFATSCESDAGAAFACQDSATHAAAGPDIQCVHDQGPTDATLSHNDDLDHGLVAKKSCKANTISSLHISSALQHAQSTVGPRWC